MKKTLAIIGNPNCGKTTLFNGLTGSNQRIGNWPGVTVEKIEGIMKFQEEEFKIIDLPGIYALSAFSEDERVSQEYLLRNEADLIINIVDAANLDRNLYLTTQIMELRVPMVIILNRIDIAEKQNKIIDVSMLSAQLGVPVIETVATRKGEIEKIKHEIRNLVGNVKPTNRKIEYPDEIERVIKKWSEKFISSASITPNEACWLATKLLEKEEWITKKILSDNILSEKEIETEIANIEKLLHETTDIIIADYRYGFIQGITKKCVTQKSNKKEITDTLDKILLNRFLALPIFAVAMYVVFWVTLFFGGSFIDFFEGITGVIFVDSSKIFLSSISAPPWLITIISDGLGAGIQAVASFIPIIFCMFFMLSILEDSGYMARAAFIMDRFMRIIGLPGKSFVPLMIGFGCSVPAVMAARTLEEKRDRMITIFMTPFMSCGARLSVYALFTTAFFYQSAGAIVLSLYAIGIILAVLTGLLIKKTFYSGEPSYFVMELPTYNFPRLQHIMIHTWSRLKLFIFSAGKIIVIAVMFLSFANSLGTDGSFGNENTEKSLLTTIGKKITPVFAPFGITEENWPAGVALFSGPFAKEAIVGTLNTLYSQIENEVSTSASSEPIKEKLIAGILSIPENLSRAFSLKEETSEEETDSGMLSKMRKYFGAKTSAYSYLLFILIYFPCFATVGAVYREAGLPIAVSQVLYMTILGWCVSVLFYQIFEGHSLFWINTAIFILLLIVLVFFIAGKIIRKAK